MFCIPSLTRTVPLNYVLMFAFTFAEAYVVSFVCAAVYQPQIVIAAAFLTAMLVLGLTFYAFYTDSDFTTMGALAFILGALFIGFGLLSYFFGPTMRFVYCAIGVFLFGFYLVIDTQMIMGDKKYRLQGDDYILGAIILYMDIINIFLYLVQILAQMFGV